jgi:hypothetical protein
LFNSVGTSTPAFSRDDDDGVLARARDHRRARASRARPVARDDDDDDGEENALARVAIGDMAVPARARVCGTSDGFGFHGS